MEQQKRQDTLYGKKNKFDFSASTMKAVDNGKRPMSVTIHKKKPEEILALLQNVQNFPLFFEGLEKIDMKDTQNGTWQFKQLKDQKSFTVPMRLSFGTGASQSLLWKAEDAAGFSYSIDIEILPAQSDRGTIVRMNVAYDNLAGDIAGFFEKLFGKDAEVTTKKNLQRLKAFCETGHVPTTEGQPSGRNEDLSPEMKH